MAEEQEPKPKLLSLRLPLDMYTQVSDLADKERRSIHSQLLVLIEDALTALQPKPEEQAATKPGQPFNPAVAGSRPPFEVR